MTRTVDVEGSNRLPELAAQIKAEHKACAEALQTALQHAVAAGKMLIEAKAQLPHGQWLPWLRDQCSLSERKAQRYMRIAPHVCKSDTLSDLTRPDPITWEWAAQLLDRPFIDRDFAADDLHWLKIKLMHHAGVPAVPALLAAEDEIEGHPLLRLCSFDDLNAATKALAPLASDKAPFRIDRASMSDVLEAIEALKILSMWLTGKLLTEIKYRFDLPDDDDERYQHEWHETHAAWMASLEAAMTGIKHQREGASP
jgi:hypothetical protein